MNKLPLMRSLVPYPNLRKKYIAVQEKEKEEEEEERRRGRKERNDHF
jgi:hypothetical protein